jgi:hypothetical protein
MNMTQAIRAAIEKAGLEVAVSRDRRNGKINRIDGRDRVTMASRFVVNFLSGFGMNETTRSLEKEVAAICQSFGRTMQTPIRSI